MKLGRLAAAIITIFWMGPAHSGIFDGGMTNVRFDRILMTDGAAFGGCLALMSGDPATKLPACGANWLSFDCTGSTGRSKSEGLAMKDVALLAYLNSALVDVKFTADYGLVNGYCVVTRVDLK